MSDRDVSPDSRPDSRAETLASERNSRTDSLDDQLSEQTETYLSTITECVNLLPQLLDDYWRGRGYQETADEIRALESECDETHRRVSSLLSNVTVGESGLRNIRIHLNPSQILELYQQLDEIANVTEQIAEELITIKPSRVEPHFQRFREMTKCATTAMAVLDDVVSTFTRLLCSPDRTGTITDEIRAIREAESSCDSLRNELVEGVFADDSVDQPLVYREFALLFDQLTDSMEDVTDQVILISSSESWIRTEAALEL